MYEFESKTGKVTFDHNKCARCKSYACVKACSIYNTRGILRIHQGKPLLAIPPEDAKRGLCTECLSCEYECTFRGQKAIKIFLPLREH